MDQWWMLVVVGLGAVRVLGGVVRGLVSVWMLAITVRGMKGVDRVRALRACVHIALAATEDKPPRDLPPTCPEPVPAPSSWM